MVFFKRNFVLYYSAEDIASCHFRKIQNMKHKSLQECVPVGCVPPTLVAVTGCVQGVYIPPCPTPLATPLHPTPLCHTPLHHTLPFHNTPLPKCMLGYTPRVDRVTDGCENITFPQLRMRAVINITWHYFLSFLWQKQRVIT